MKWKARQKADTSQKPETSLVAHEFVIVAWNGGCYTESESEW